MHRIDPSNRVTLFGSVISELQLGGKGLVFRLEPDLDPLLIRRADRRTEAADPW